MEIQRCVSSGLHGRAGPSGRFEASFPQACRKWVQQPLRSQRRLQRAVRAPALGVMPNRPITLKTTLDTMETMDSLGTVECDECDEEEAFINNYQALDVIGIVRERGFWLALFAIGLLLAAGVVEEFDDLISKHVELSFFVPLIMGHGGNTGSQTTCAVIRALALKQVCFKDAVVVVGKEAAAGCMMGAALGLSIFVLATATHAVSQEVGLVVAISLPVISLWANGLGAFLTLASAKMNLDPALTSAPLVTTIVDTTGLVIYFVIAQQLVSENSFAVVALAAAGQTQLPV